MKEYKTFNQQLTILRNRGLIVPTDGKPKRFLEQENYYNVINGYKDLFLLKDTHGKPVEPETYYIKTGFYSENFGDWLNTIKGRSIYDFGISVGEDDKVLTLSTCDNSGTKRVAVHAKMINIEYK